MCVLIFSSGLLLHKHKNMIANLIQIIHYQMHYLIYKTVEESSEYIIQYAYHKDKVCCKARNVKGKPLYLILLV